MVRTDTDTREWATGQGRPPGGRNIQVRDGLLEDVTQELGFECIESDWGKGIWAEGLAMQRACGSNELNMFEKQPGG